MSPLGGRWLRLAPRSRVSRVSGGNRWARGGCGALLILLLGTLLHRGQRRLFDGRPFSAQPKAGRWRRRSVGLYGETHPSESKRGEAPPQSGDDPAGATVAAVPEASMRSAISWTSVPGSTPSGSESLSLSVSARLTRPFRPRTTTPPANRGVASGLAMAQPARGLRGRSADARRAQTAMCLWPVISIAAWAALRQKYGCPPGERRERWGSACWSRGVRGADDRRQETLLAWQLTTGGQNTTWEQKVESFFFLFIHSSSSFWIRE